MLPTKRLAGISMIAISSVLFLPNTSHAQDDVKAPPSEVLSLYDIAEAPSADRIQNDIQTLVDFGTRHTLSETQSETRGIGAARRWIHSEFQKISSECGGCLEVIYVSDTIQGESRIPNPTEVVSVLAIQRGSIDPNRYVMMSGDIDSRVTDPLNGTSDSPGANDNASGMAGALEAARVLSKYKFAGSIIYAGLSGEEQGLFGGEIVAEHALANGWQIKGVLNNDMISNITGIDGVINNSTVRVFSEGTRANETPEEARQRRFTGGEVDSPSRNLARYVKSQSDQYMTNLDVMMVYRLDRFGRGGHHRPFNKVGIPGVRIMETHEHYDRQHQDLRQENGVTYGDTMEGVDSDYAAKLTALNAITLAGMAGAPPFPMNVEASGAVKPSAKLTWETPSNAANLAGYRVHWRLTTEPEWTHSRFVGKVNEWEFTNLVIDNYFFGVSAVAKDGSQTPVVFPGAAGRF
ncbi:peptidase M28-like protein [Litorimonas taeanensis]|uniref:Peptidase M28-like protein n=1 Tax=Litorimonas taeanensis TaxID=568099 RepID=A0A420WK43_9PROT|nr:M28 family metallopeptidase [Litorimonas taeanensis]RKQ71309.1 peptidase M28-like protein [Litorimonas taeanensis]